MTSKRKREASKAPGAILAQEVPEGPEGIQVFRDAIKELQTKSQSKIGQLTGLAEQLYANSSGIVQAVVDEINGASRERIQPLLFVVDSILKKVGKDYKTFFADRLPVVLRAAYQKSDDSGKSWLQKMVNDSWKKHELLPLGVFDRLESIFGPDAPALAKAAASQAVKAEPEPESQAASVGKLSTAAGQPSQATSQQAASVASKPTQSTPADDEVVARRLTILTKIIERKPPQPDELQEIMKVPEIRKAIAMQQKGQRHEATALLSQYKSELEKRHAELMAEKDPRLKKAQGAASAGDPRRPAGAAKPADPRQQLDPRRPQDPRQSAAGAAEAKPADPRQPVDPRSRQAADEAAAETAASAPSRKNEAPPAKKRVKAEEPGPETTAADGQKQPAPPGDVTTVVSDDDIEKIISDDEGDAPKEPTQQVVQAMPSIGFSEAWLRQFMSQMPSRGMSEKQRAGAPSVGRKVISASGDQMVYVDEISPSEMLLLSQFVFMLEDRLRQNGRAVDLSQRLPHTFSFLQADLAVDVMLKWVFEELPHQCNTTGLRFATRDKLRRHNEALSRRKQLRQRNAEARGWMEPIPDWVGNRDLVVGPSLFRLGSAREDEAKRAESLLIAVPQGADREEEDAASIFEAPLDERRAVCPISGERFETTWSNRLNDWTFVDAVASEMNSTRPLKFPPGGPMGPHGLSETAVLFKGSCFSNSPISHRLEALHDCRADCSTDGNEGGARQTAAQVGKEDQELSSLMKDRPLLRSFF